MKKTILIRLITNKDLLLGTNLNVVINEPHFI
jgi:hypothetical protein